MKARNWVVITALTAVTTLTGAGIALAQEDSGSDTETSSIVEMLVGILEKIERDYFVNGTEVGFGPFFYRDSTTSPADFDGDGVTGTVTAELDALVGTEVSIEAEGGDALTVNGAVYRQAGTKPAWAGMPSWAPGPPPWAGSTG